MTKNPTNALAALLLGVAFSSTARAQTVILSEVFVDAGDQWVEIHNRTGLPVDLSSWSLHAVTATPGRPQTYWWAFPTGTVIEGNGYLRVHWYAAAPTTAVPGELWTGATIHHFLFGLGGESLPRERGALALLRSRQNAMMNTPSIYADYVCWGQGGLSREYLAVQAGLWQNDTATAPIATATSLARHEGSIARTPLRRDEWFADSTPTPMRGNAGEADVRAVGVPCTTFGSRLFGPPTMTANSMPALGNASFALEIDHTTGVLYESILLAFSLGEAPAGQPPLLPPPPAGPRCSEYLDAGRALGVVFARSRVGGTELPLSLASLPPALAGARFTVQALVLDGMPFAYPPYLGTTNALTITLGN